MSSRTEIERSTQRSSGAGDRLAELKAIQVDERKPRSSPSTGVSNAKPHWLASGVQPKPVAPPMSARAARVHPAAPVEIQRNQKLLTVKYYAFDGKLMTGQLVADRRVLKDLEEIFRFAREIKFPMQSVIPVAAFGWNDDSSMKANNTSAFNYREITGGGQISMHAFGYAIDINPFINPYVKGTRVEPAGAYYLPGERGTLTTDHPLVKKFRSLGWNWGGDWVGPAKDYQHFEKPLPQDYLTLSHANRTLSDGTH